MNIYKDFPDEAWLGLSPYGDDSISHWYRRQEEGHPKYLRADRAILRANLKERLIAMSDSLSLFRTFDEGAQWAISEILAEFCPPGKADDK